MALLESLISLTERKKSQSSLMAASGTDAPSILGSRSQTGHIGCQR